MEDLQLNKHYRITLRETESGEARVIEGIYRGPFLPGWQGIPTHALGHVFRDSTGRRRRVRTDDVLAIEEI